MAKPEQVPAEKGAENTTEKKGDMQEVQVIIGGVLEKFKSRAEYRKFLQDQLNEQA